MLRSVAFCLVSLSIIGFFNQVYAKIDPDVLDYHLKLARGIVETCYTRDPDTDNLTPNPTLPILSDLKNTCDKKIKSLDNFLAKFVEDENGKLYASHLSDIPGIEPIR